MDITFSDHRMTVATIDAFGEVIQAIHRVCDDKEIRFWSFIRYISLHHQDILGVNLPEEQQKECDAVLAKADPPTVTVEEPEHLRSLHEDEARNTSET